MNSKEASHTTWSANLALAFESVSEKNGGVTVQLDHRSASELVKMLTDGAKKRGCVMSPSAARLLIETSGEDINTLASELEKLCFYAPGSEITEKHIENVAVKTVEASVYELSSFIFSIPRFF